jgi:hypothetical protein
VRPHVYSSPLRYLIERHSGLSPGSVTSLAWTSDGYGLAVGYEQGWAVWSISGRIGGWGMADNGGDNESVGNGESEGFMKGVKELVSHVRWV